MDRSPFYPGSIWRSFDVGNQGRDTLKAIGRVVQAMLGSTATYVTGLTATANSVPNMTIILSSGQIYQWGAVDTNTFGSLALDNTPVVQQGYTDSQILTLNVAQLSGSQQQYALIQATFMQVDAVRSGDPTGGVLPFMDSTNPLVPKYGPDGLGGTLPTVRKGHCNIQVLYGTPAAAGSAVPPVASAGYVGLYLILLSTNQLTIIQDQIQKAGPEVYAGYTPAPFLAGLLASHHNGNVGQAPKINLAGEVQGILPLANCPASNTIGILPTLRVGTVSPNGNVAGQHEDLYYRTDVNALFVCVTSGTAGTAVWQGFGTSPQVIHVNTFPYTITNIWANYHFDVTAGNGVVNLPNTAAAANAQITCTKIDASENEVILTAAVGQNTLKGNKLANTLKLSTRDASATLTPSVTGAFAGTWVTI